MPTSRLTWKKVENIRDEHPSNAGTIAVDFDETFLNFSLD